MLQQGAMVQQLGPVEGPFWLDAAPGLLGAAQTWTVTDSAANLNISGPLSGSASLTKAGGGRVTLSGIAAADFNPAGTSTLTVAGGSLIQSHPFALG